MSKESIVKQMHEDLSNQGIDITMLNLGKIHDAWIKRIKGDLKRIGKVRLHRLGTLSTAVSRKKQCRNPQNGKIMTVPEKIRVRFKASQTLLGLLNEEEEEVVS